MAKEDSFKLEQKERWVSSIISWLKGLPFVQFRENTAVHVSRYVYFSNVHLCVLQEEKDKHSKEKLFTLKDSVVFGTRIKRNKTQPGIGLHIKWDFQRNEDEVMDKRILTRRGIQKYVNTIT